MGPWPDVGQVAQCTPERIRGLCTAWGTQGSPGELGWCVSREGSLEAGWTSAQGGWGPGGSPSSYMMLGNILPFWAHCSCKGVWEACFPVGEGVGGGLGGPLVLSWPRKPGPAHPSGQLSAGTFSPGVGSGRPASLAVSRNPAHLCPPPRTCHLLCG